LCYSEIYDDIWMRIMSENQFVEVTYGNVSIEAPPKKLSQRYGGKTVDGLVFLRTAAINSFFVGLAVLILTITAIEMLRKPVIIEKIGLPQQLSDLGYSESVAASRLWDAILEIQKVSGTAKTQTPVQTATAQLNLIEPSTGLSLQSITQMLRQIFRMEQTRIAGEFICGDPECTKPKIVLRLRVITSEGMTVLPDKPMGAQNMDAYFKVSALKLLKEIDPYIVAAYYYRSNEDPDRSIEMARKLVADNHPHAAWAANLLANDEYTRGNYQAAIKLYDESSKLAEYHKMSGFALPWYNWGLSLAALGDHKAALLEFERATIEDDDFALAWLGWGISLAKLGRHEKAIEKFEYALKIDSKDASAWYSLGLRHAAKGRHEEAIEKFEYATQIDSKDASAWYSLGLSHAEIGDHDAALLSFERATTEDSDFVLAWLSWGTSLTKLGRHDEANEKYEIATQAASGAASIWLGWSHNLDAQGRPKEASEKRKTSIQYSHENAVGGSGNKAGTPKPSEPEM
jgi:tetratricopeptide (TPR) repeat protein